MYFIVWTATRKKEKITDSEKVVFTVHTVIQSTQTPTHTNMDVWDKNRESDRNKWVKIIYMMYEVSEIVSFETKVK